MSQSFIIKKNKGKGGVKDRDKHGMNCNHYTHLASFW